MIEARKISKIYSVVNQHGIAEKITAVQSVSLTVQDGRIVSLLGPSGCGKSTLLEILAGLQIPTEGEVFIDGVRVLEPLPSSRREIELYRRKYRFLSPLANRLIRNTLKYDIAVIFQDYAIFPWMTVLKNVVFALKMRGVDRHERKDKAIEYLKRVDLSSDLNKYPSQLSGGMRQRLALARALAVEPKIILMDEPFAAVDTLTRERLQDDLLGLWKMTKVTIILVTHDISEALYLSDEVFVFSSNPGTIQNHFLIDELHRRRRNSPQLHDLEQKLIKICKYNHRS
ncbi:MAG TPA: ABC transporter ATP-binding protein [Chitinispirillaceae bacterium]|nr:ABC transporter ATP-binding protein [Chitinispirillaceae bacterium]